MKAFESQHYLFHYEVGTAAERDIEEIADKQERCFAHICSILGISPSIKIEYFLCNSPKDVGRIYGDNEPCNGFTVMPNKIYAVYSDKDKCVGFHEDAHIISYTVNRPDCPAIREGLAMYFDRKWWGIHNLDWVWLFLKYDLYIPVEKLLDKEFFFAQECSITYPIMGAFTEWLISRFGIEKFKCLFMESDIVNSVERIYGVSPAELNHAFASYVQLFDTDTVLEGRMLSLIE